MKEKKLESFIKVYASENELDQRDKDLFQKAKEASSKAYAPYSHFFVGAALELDNGKIISGNNQENVAYPSGLCAERVALFHAGSLYPESSVKAIAITAKCDSNPVTEPACPCGGCLQVLSETESRSGNEIRIILGGEQGEIFIAEGTKNFLPLQFKNWR